ncbi:MULTISPECIES: hypothetical protein [Asticcacaulis]|uniref:hypothetical protein n=1 Tax=Asticcacaulis TaxID=76890 RepID=UPI001AE76E7F|nr:MULTISPECIES: hypothetical protein [Asticcacaulis]MBP2161649.1 hypothetical protein [Asticcacaulis solisilvae]MDR6802726.1 hypothetical protein [Asticcacaulis sp. BE141]
MDWYLAHVIWVNAGWLTFVACMVLAIWKGGPTEKRGAALIATGCLLSPVLTRFDGPGPGLYVQALDTLLTLGFVALALQSRRLWVFVICMCSLNGLITYFVTGYEAFSMYAFVTATGFWLGYAWQLCLIFGVIDYQRTLRRQSDTPKPA